MLIIKRIIFVTAVLFTSFTYADEPDVLLAKVYDETKHIDVSAYLVSEKFDGVRAIWTGAEFVTRKGNVIHAPSWFIAPLPNTWLDGELWTKRENFSVLTGIVRTKVPIDEEWEKVTYKVFDMPDNTLPFSQRYKNYTQLIKQINTSHVHAIKQHRFINSKQLTQYFDDITKQGAEGVMLHLASAKHTAGRSDALLKLKPYLDAEAIVIAHLPGKGKYKGMLGAIRVKSEKGKVFSIGTGFSNVQRQTPPAIGSTITYRYYGFTKSGKPRFASFLRVRESI